MTVIVIAGGLSHERDVSLRSGRRVAQALRDVGRTVVETDVNADLVSLIRATAEPVVVPMLHGGLGEDGARVVMSVVLFLVLAAGLFTVARGLARGAAWARTPALVWNAVLLPIAWNLTEAGAYGWAALLCAVALVGLVGILAAGRGRQD